MKTLTIRELSIQSKEKRQVLNFVYDNLNITVLPPLKDFLRGGNTLYDYKYSIFINNIIENKLGKHNKEIHKQWFNTNRNEETTVFRNSFLQFMFDVKVSNTDNTILKAHLNDIVPFIEYQSEFRALFDNKVGKIPSSYSLYEYNELRAKNQLIFNNRNIELKIDDIDIEILKEPKRKINLIL